MRIHLQPATPEDAPEIAMLRNRISAVQTTLHGTGHWSGAATEKGVLFNMRTSRVLVARGESGIIATLRLGTKKPWAIDKSYFTLCEKPLYLTDMAVVPELQRQGIGRLCLEEMLRIAREWPADAIRLDAYDATAGAGEFYRRCGFREVGRVVYRNTPLIFFETLL
ncbi:MAG TPA: N-acetyltransferase [Thermoanaerobaculia bacterium]|nr:N-acetyltransferase [Thermoanaerobaculia bacterium]